jgi:hypothetical protein
MSLPRMIILELAMASGSKNPPGLKGELADSLRNLSASFCPCREPEGTLQLLL